MQSEAVARLPSLATAARKSAIRSQGADDPGRLPRRAQRALPQKLQDESGEVDGHSEPRPVLTVSGFPIPRRPARVTGGSPMTTFRVGQKRSKGSVRSRCTRKKGGEWRAARADFPTTSARLRVDHPVARGRGRRRRAPWHGSGRRTDHDDDPHDDHHDARAVDHHDAEPPTTTTTEPSTTTTAPTTTTPGPTTTSPVDDDDGARHVEGAEQPVRRGQRAEPRAGARDQIRVRRPVGHRAQAARRAPGHEGHARQPSVRPGDADPPDRDGQEPARRDAHPRPCGRRRDTPDHRAHSPHRARDRAPRRRGVPRRPRHGVTQRARHHWCHRSGPGQDLRAVRRQRARRPRRQTQDADPPSRGRTHQCRAGPGQGEGRRRDAEVARHRAEPGRHGQRGRSRRRADGRHQRDPLRREPARTGRRSALRR